VKKILLADRDLPGLSNRAKLPSEHVPREPGLQGGEGHEGGVHLSEGRQPRHQGVHGRQGALHRLLLPRQQAAL